MEVTRPLTVCLYTHMRHPDRLTYAKRTVRGIVKHCIDRYDGPKRLHIADDDSDPEMMAELVELATKMLGYEPTVTHGAGRGYGASHNAATQVTHTGDAERLLLPLEDDWELVRDLPAARIAAYFDNPDVRSVRLGYIGWTKELRGTLVKAGDDTCLLFDPLTPEMHVNAGHPRIESVAYQRDVGIWAETIDPGSTEVDWCTRDQARRGVIWPMDLGLTPSAGTTGAFFHHIGGTQARRDQRQET